MRRVENTNDTLHYQTKEASLQCLREYKGNRLTSTVGVYNATTNVEFYPTPKQLRTLAKWLTGCADEMEAKR